MTAAGIARLFRLPRPGENVEGWHVSPVVDVVAYSFSWLLILVPLALAGDAHPGDYLGLWAAGITVSFLHRHFTMPYVYLDGAVFQTHKTRFTLFPAVLFCGFLGSVLLYGTKIPKGFFSAVDVAVFAAACAVVVDVWKRDKKGEAFDNAALFAGVAPFVVAVVLGALGVFKGAHVAGLVVVAVVTGAAASYVGGVRLAVVVGAILGAGLLAALAIGPLNATKMKGNVVVGAAAMVAALWNIWHTAAQKVGILRVYNAKRLTAHSGAARLRADGAAVDDNVPLWVDRLLVFGWFPLLAALLVTRERETILTQGKVVKIYLEPLLDGMQLLVPVLVPAGVVVVVTSIALFLRYEWRATKLRSWPRLTMALGMTLLSASFLFVSPLKCYVAYGFSHAVEYVVFVWAYQRKRYAVPHSPPPLLQRMLRFTWLFYGVFTLAIAGTYFYVSFGNAYGFYEGKLRFLGATAGTWLYAWAIWHSLTHFYFDGFLWKMRAPTVRQHL